MTTNESRAPQDPEDILVDSIFNVSSAIMSSSELMLAVNVEGEMLEMEVGTGSTVAMISTADHKRVFQHIPLKPPSRSFHVYAGAKSQSVKYGRMSRLVTERRDYHWLWLTQSDMHHRYLVATG